MMRQLVKYSTPQKKNVLNDNQHFLRDYYYVLQNDFFLISKLSIGPVS